MANIVEVEAAARSEEACIRIKGFGRPAGSDPIRFTPVMVKGKDTFTLRAADGKVVTSKLTGKPVEFTAAQVDVHRPGGSHGSFDLK